MTIDDVLSHDMNVNEIDVTVKDRTAARHTMRYVVSIDANRRRPERFLYATEAGDMCGTLVYKTLYLKNKSQFTYGKSPYSTPKEILFLEVDDMTPYNCDKPDDWHGYKFTCIVDKWNGVPGEDQVG